MTLAPPPREQYAQVSSTSLHVQALDRIKLDHGARAGEPDTLWSAHGGWQTPIRLVAVATMSDHAAALAPKLHPSTGARTCHLPPPDPTDSDLQTARLVCG